MAHEPALPHAPVAPVALAAALALAGVGLASDARGAGPYASGRVYAEVQVGAGNVDVSGLRFYPPIGGVAVGAYVRDGIGVELHADGGIDVDDDGGFELGLDGATGLGVRFESPPTRGTSGYITLGYSAWTLSQEPAGPGTGEVDEDFTGARASIGLVKRLERVPALSLSAEYRAWYVDDGLSVTSLLLGLRLSAP